MSHHKVRKRFTERLRTRWRDITNFVTVERAFGDNGGVASRGAVIGSSGWITRKTRAFMPVKYSKGVVDRSTDVVSLTASRRRPKIYPKSWRTSLPKLTVERIEETSIKVKFEFVPNNGLAFIIVWGETDGGTSDHENWDDFATMGTGGGTVTRVLTGLSDDTPYYIASKHGDLGASHHRNNGFSPVEGPFKTLP